MRVFSFGNLHDIEFYLEMGLVSVATGMNLIFPVAGKGERFGGVFKPFLKIGDITFIEKTLESFGDLSAHRAFFICTREQDEKYEVARRMKSIIGDQINFEVIAIEKDTNGPFETILEALKIRNLTGMSIVCDCDHRLDALPIMQKTGSGDFDLVIPTYEIKPEEYKNWSKIILENGKVVRAVEKEFVDSVDFKGIVGCFGFRKIEELKSAPVFNFVSEYINHMVLLGRHLSCVPATGCLFYGDVEMYEKTLNELRSKCTVFCDIDGVIIKHNPHSDYEEGSNIMLPGCEILKEIRESGHKIILTTARNGKRKSDLVELLGSRGIVYDDLIMDCRPGHRILINDRKPSKPFQPQAISFELQRDCGLGEFDINSYSCEFSTKILGKMEGNSFADTYLIEKSGNKAIRKHILKSPQNEMHYRRLKRQFEDIKRFKFLSEMIVPKPLAENDCKFDYFYDIEYMEGYSTLSSFENDSQIKILCDIADKMQKDVYSLRKKLNGKEWFKNFIESKLNLKLNLYEKIDEGFCSLVSDGHVEINGKKYMGIKKILKNLDSSVFFPKHISPIHGDMSLENILFNGMDWRLIDMDGSDFFDAPEQDIGKIAQSTLGGYKRWKDIVAPAKSLGGGRFECISDFFEKPSDGVFDSISDCWGAVLDKGSTKENAIFYMCCYFIRFVPFRMKVSKEHGYFALIMSVIWLNKLLGGAS